MPSTGTELELRSFRVHEPAAPALQRVLAAIQTGEQMNHIYAVRSRTKSVGSIREKCQRKRTDKNNPKPDYEPEDITDVVGVRVVTLFREDMVDVAKLFLRMVKHQPPHTMSPFVKDELKEKIIYTTPGYSDPEAINSRLRTAFESAGFPLHSNEIRTADSGYSSVHLIVMVGVPDGTNIRKVPVEVQIRTVFEDAWGEIDHKLKYSQSRNQVVESTQPWSPHLNVLKMFTDGCAQYAGIIKGLAMEARTKSLKDLRPLQPIDTIDEALSQIGAISQNLDAALKAAYSKRDAANQAKSDRAEGAANLFKEAAEAFEFAAGMTSKETFQAAHRKDAALYFCRMEKAFCLLSIETKPALDEAISIYSDVQKFAPNSAVVHYRYAQALMHLGELDESITKYQHAQQLLSADPYIPEDHFLHDTIPRNIGYVLWTKSLNCPDSEEGRAERLRLLIEAYEHTKAAYDKASKPNRKTRTANNVLYYGVEYLGLLEAGEEGKIPATDLKCYLQLVEESVDLATAPRSQLNWLDTLCRAYALLDEPSKAVLVAERIEHLLSAPTGTAGTINSGKHYYAITGHLNNVERDVLDHALWVLRRDGPGPERSRNDK